MSAFRPVSGALAQAVARRRRSINLDTNNPSASSLDYAFEPGKNKNSTSIQVIDLTYAERPVPWTPKPPSKILPSKRKDFDDPEIMEDDPSSYTSPRPSRQRVAHKPTIPKNTKNRPRYPRGNSRKVPVGVRTKYLDVIIDEYLKHGYPEDESYRSAIEEEEAIAGRAANKCIYLNLIASLKKKIREKAGVSTSLPASEVPEFVNGNRVVSHSDILTGKGVGTFSVVKRKKSSNPEDLNEYELYDTLSRYIMPQDQIELYNYPVPDPDQPEIRKVPLGKDNQRQYLRSELSPTYICERCTKVYRIDTESGLPLETTGKCIYHAGHLWNERINRAIEKRYSCCKGDPSAGGCSSNPYHVHRGELELVNYQNYVETQPKPERDPNKHGIYALDCEMCHTTYGLELTRVTVMNHKYEVVYEKLVKPSHPVLDYNTKFSGIKEGDLEFIHTQLSHVQADLLKMFSSKSILIGHSLDSDMRALKMFHTTFIDTAQLFPHKRGLPFKRALRTLMVENLRVIIQDSDGHDSKEDAGAALRLVMWKARTDVPEKSE